MPYDKSAKEVAAHYRISLRTVRRIIQRRRIPHMRIRGSLRFDLDEVEGFMKHECRVEARKVA